MNYKHENKIAYYIIILCFIFIIYMISDIEILIRSIIYFEVVGLQKQLWYWSINFWVTVRLKSD